jgi:uncharacterized protein YndB with AHSA1/START domain
MPNILHRITIKAPPDRVYRAISTAEGVRNWWTRDADLDSAEGGTGEFRFYGGTNVKTVRIEKLAHPEEVQWTVLSSKSQPFWEGTTITFHLRPDESGTVLSFFHRGFKEESEGFAMVTTGWAYFLVSLQQYLEKGRGAPSPDVDFARVLS